MCIKDRNVFPSLTIKSTGRFQLKNNQKKGVVCVNWTSLVFKIIIGCFDFLDGKKVFNQFFLENESKFATINVFITTLKLYMKVNNQLDFEVYF